MEWKPIPGYENYHASPCGQILSTLGRPMAQHLTKWGYPKVVLATVNGPKNEHVHKLIAITFLGPQNDRAVNHIDANRSNNRVENLEWVTWKQNSEHTRSLGNHSHGERHYASKLTEREAQSILDLKHILPKQEIADVFGVKHCTVEDIHRGKKWKHLVSSRLTYPQQLGPS